ncbi:hypothetical protein Tco_1530596 [Tanacetum coccineum]
MSLSRPQIPEHIHNFAGSHFLQALKPNSNNPSPGAQIFGISDTFEDTVHDDLLVFLWLSSISFIAFPRFLHKPYTELLARPVHGPCELPHARHQFMDNQGLVRRKRLCCKASISLLSRQSPKLCSILWISVAMAVFSGHHSFHVAPWDRLALASPKV